MRIEDLAKESPQLLQCAYLADFEWHLPGVLVVKLFLPVSFEVDGIHKDQLSVRVHCTWRQQLFDFI